jgi:hypothetical protein
VLRKRHLFQNGHGQGLIAQANWAWESKKKAMKIMALVFNCVAILCD